jgi:hypothetical protein
MRMKNGMAVRLNFVRESKMLTVSWVSPLTPPMSRYMAPEVTRRKEKATGSPINIRKRRLPNKSKRMKGHSMDSYKSSNPLYPPLPRGGLRRKTRKMNSIINRNPPMGMIAIRRYWGVFKISIAITPLLK